MRVDRIIEAFLQREDKFFKLFEETAQHLITASDLMVKLMNCPAEERLAVSQEIHKLEHLCDDTAHRLFSELNATFVTPFDREDIMMLASALDDVMDFLDESARRIILYKITSIPANMKQLADVLKESITETHHGVSHIRNIHKTEGIRKTLERIHACENKADMVFEMGIADLFDNEKDPINLVKLKDIYTSLERSTDKCEDVANVLEAILIKHA